MSVPALRPMSWQMNKARSCEGKVGYHTEHIARDIARKILSEGGAGTNRLWPYPCAHCRRWHLTKQGGLNPHTLPATAHELREGVA